MLRTALAVLPIAIGLVTTSAPAQQVDAESFMLDNGMEFLLVPRANTPNTIAAGWVAKVGSVNERPGITGISHFFEHMMFKGTTTIGTADAEQDRAFRLKQREVKTRLNDLIWRDQYERYLRGEIGDPWDAANDTDEIAALRAELRQLMDDHAEVIVNNEFDLVYTRLGGSGMNAFTSYDLTFYFINVPSNKFELWAWMESNRLTDSVFREFYLERDVVHEERRLRTESTPTGVFQEQFDAMFWMASPYAWPVIGWPSDLNSYTMEQALAYYDIYYRPNNLVGIIVGDFDPAEIKPVIRAYFSRLERGPQEPPPVVTLEIEQLAEKRLIAECDCQPQVEIRYHTVPFRHEDSYALEMMAAVLNGRTGRLYKSLVEEKDIASSAGAAAGGLGAPAKYAGFFSFQAEVKGEATPEDLEQAWYEVLTRLQEEPVEGRELQKVKNQQAADAYRRLEQNFFLLVQLGYYEALGGWEYINEGPKKLQAVTAADIQRVARTYFEPTNRNVAIYTRKAGTAPVDPELAEFNPQERGMIRQILSDMQARSLEELTQTLTQMNGVADQVPPERRPVFEYIIGKIEERVAALQAAEEDQP